jgi:competence protein ComEC
LTVIFIIGFIYTAVNGISSGEKKTENSGNKTYTNQEATTQTYKDFVTAVKNKGLSLTVPKVGEQFKLGEAAVTALAPKNSEYEDSNDYSIVLKVTFGSTSFLLTGDAEALSEKELVASGKDLSATVLKVGHHGSLTSTSQALLDKINPMFAVVSAGAGNKYGHPAQETMDKLKTKGVKVFRTDEQKTIVAISNGKDINFNVKPGSNKGITK